MKKVLALIALTLSLFAGDVTAKFKIEGMTCPMCVANVKGTMTSIYGVKSASVSLKEGSATAVIDERLSPADIAQEVTKKGFKTTVVK
jgi:copper chaperone CopZ